MKNYKLIYSQDYLDGLRETVEYIKKDSSRAAKIFAHKVREKVRMLKQFPEMGQAATDKRLEGIRILVVGNYLVLYEAIHGQKSVHLHVFCHGARDYPNLYKDLSLE
jgi:plasmid stabilization system protein ParE